jgi:hypothetical protein
MAGQKWVFARDVPVIDVFDLEKCKTWMPDTRPGMTAERLVSASMVE